MARESGGYLTGANSLAERARTRQLQAALRARAPVEPQHRVGAPGEPGFQFGWYNADPTNRTVCAFWRDPLRQVYLAGYVDTAQTVQVTTSYGTTRTEPAGPIFTLPAGWRPATVVVMRLGAGGDGGALRIHPDGQVRFEGGAFGWDGDPIGIDGIRFHPT